MFIKLILALSVFYVLALTAIYFVQSIFIYAPHMPSRELSASPADIFLDYKDVYLKTLDQETIHGWFIPVHNAKQTVLFFHGNAGNISHRLETIKIYHRLGVNVFIFDYRGYGISTGKPSEKGTYLDAKAAWEYLIDQKKLKPENIILAGRSLGGGVASELAKKVNPAMLILESTFTSMVDVSRIHYPFMPTDLIVKHRYESIDNLKSITCPVVIIHSKYDEVIPFHHGKKLFEAANEPKNFIELKGGHGSGFLISKHIYVAALDQALVRVSR